MKLIGSYTSPFVRKISIIMLEKGIIFEFVNASPYSDDSHVPHYNPLGKVPALVADDKQIWFDSSIIAEFLELRGVEPALLPADPLESLNIRQLEKLADGVSDAALVIVREQMRPGICSRKRCCCAIVKDSAQPRHAGSEGGRGEMA